MKWSRNAAQRTVEFMTMSRPCWLQTGICHLPLQGLNHMLLQLLTANIPWREFRVDSRKEALCAWEKLTGHAFRDWCLQELISWAQFLHLLISKKVRKSFMVMTVSRDQQKPSAKKPMCLTLSIPPSPKSRKYYPVPLPLWSNFSELSEGLSPRLQSPFCPQRKF